MQTKMPSNVRNKQRIKGGKSFLIWGKILKNCIFIGMEGYKHIKLGVYI